MYNIMVLKWLIYINRLFWLCLELQRPHVLLNELNTYHHLFILSIFKLGFLSMFRCLFLEFVLNCTPHPHVFIEEECFINKDSCHICPPFLQDSIIFHHSEVWECGPNISGKYHQNSYIFWLPLLLGKRGQAFFFKALYIRWILIY